MSKLFESTRDDGGQVLFFYCPGCKNYHSVAITPYRNNNGATWSWNGDMEKPTFEPSLLSSRGTDRQCHLFVREGKIEYLSDSAHELRGQTVAMEDEELSKAAESEQKDTTP